MDLSWLEKILDHYRRAIKEVNSYSALCIGLKLSPRGIFSCELFVDFVFKKLYGEVIGKLIFKNTWTI